MGNIELLEKTREAILANPKEHNQDDWISFGGAVWEEPDACQTTMCTAGHAAYLSGAEVPNHYFYSNNGWRLTPEGKLTESGNGLGVPVAEWAREKLGMNCDEEDYIFYCMDNDLVIQRIDHVLDLWRMGDEFSYAEHEPVNVEDDYCCEFCD